MSDNNVHLVELLTKIKLRQQAFDKELNSNSERADLLLITNNIEASVKDIYELLMHDPNSRRHRREDFLKELKKRGYLNDNLKDDLSLMFEIRDEYAHNMLIDEAHQNSESYILQMSVYKEIFSKDKDWNKRKTREKIIRVYNNMMQEVYRQFSNATINEL